MGVLLLTQIKPLWLDFIGDEYRRILGGNYQNGLWRVAHTGWEWLVVPFPLVE